MIKPKVMSVLVTGANGFVGSALVPELILQGYGVKQLVRTKNSYAKSNIKTFYIDSIDNNIDFKKPLAGVDVVIHLAARVHVMTEMYSNALNEYRRINVDATLNLARQAASFGIKRFIFVSSVKVNGELTEKNSQFSADDKPNPADAYSISKMEAENALIRLSKETNMEIVILRPPLIYGPGVKANFLSMMKLLYKNPPLPFQVKVDSGRFVLKRLPQQTKELFSLRETRNPWTYIVQIPTKSLLKELTLFALGRS
jgi:UDP-glucose 4-epimerase